MTPPNPTKKADQCYVSIGGLQICDPVKKDEPTVIPVDLGKTIHANAAKARDFKPKWAPYKPKGPGALFGDGSDYKKAVAKKDAPTKKEAPKATPTVAAPKKEEAKKVVAHKDTTTDSGIIKVDLSKYLKPGVDKALAYKPKWGTHKPKAPTAFFPDAAAYAKGPKTHKGPTTATAGMRSHVKPPKAQPSLFLTPSYGSKQGTFTLGRVFDTRNPRQLEELRDLKAGAKTYEQSMTPVRVTYVENGKVKTEEMPLLFVTDIQLTPPPAHR